MDGEKAHKEIIERLDKIQEDLEDIKKEIKKE